MRVVFPAPFGPMTPQRPGYLEVKSRTAVVGPNVLVIRPARWRWAPMRPAGGYLTSVASIPAARRLEPQVAVLENLARLGNAQPARGFQEEVGGRLGPEPIVGGENNREAIRDLDRLQFQGDDFPDPARSHRHRQAAAILLGDADDMRDRLEQVRLGVKEAVLDPDRCFRVPVRTVALVIEPDDVPFRHPLLGSEEFRVPCPAQGSHAVPRSACAGHGIHQRPSQSKINPWTHSGTSISRTARPSLRVLARRAAPSGGCKEILDPEHPAGGEKRFPRVTEGDGHMVREPALDQHVKRPISRRRTRRWNRRNADRGRAPPWAT